MFHMDISSTALLSGPWPGIVGQILPDHAITWKQWATWFATHEPACTSNFVCGQGSCQSKPKEFRLHVVLCGEHLTQNKAAIDNFKPQHQKYSNMAHLLVLYDSGALTSGVKESIARQLGSCTIRKGPIPLTVVGGGHPLVIGRIVQISALLMREVTGYCALQHDRRAKQPRG